MKIAASSHDLRVLLIQEDNGWFSAQCLEYDIAAQSRKLSDLQYEFEKTLVAHIALAEAQGIEPFEGIGPAPNIYHELYESSDQSLSAGQYPVQPDRPIRHPIPGKQFRVAA